MDRQTAREASALLATLIGEIMENHLDLALTVGRSVASDWPGLLGLASQDIATLAVGCCQSNGHLSPADARMPDRTWR